MESVQSKVGCIEGDASELRETSDKKVMEPAPGPNGQGCIEGEASELREISDKKVIESAPGPSGLVCIEGEASELRETSDKKIMGSILSKKGCIQGKESELRDIFDKIMGSVLNKMGCNQGEASELRETSDNKIMRSVLSKVGCIKRKASEFREFFDKNIIELACGPSGLECITGKASELREIFDNKITGSVLSKMSCIQGEASELQEIYDKKVMEPSPGPSGLGCIEGEVSELRETSDNTVVVPVPGQNINITGSKVHEALNSVALNNVKTEGNININMPENALDYQVSEPLFYGFPPRIENEVCVGREEDIEELLKLVKNNQYVLIRGCGGMGKTTLAMKCAEMWTKAGKFKKASFLLMETMETANSSFNDLATKYNLKSEKKSISKELRSLFDKINKNKTLLVLDNIDDEMAIERYLPQKNNHPNIFVLGTSQQDIPRLFHGYALIDLPETAAMELVKSILNSPTDIPQKLLRKLVKSLDCLALAVRQAACVICQEVKETRKDTVEAIETYIKECYAKLDEKVGQEYLNHYEKTVYKALYYNIRKCVNEDVIAKKLLHVFSYLNPTLISEDSKDFLKQVLEVTEEELNKIIYRFVRYSLVTEVEGCLTIHRTTQAVARLVYADAKGEVLPCLFHMIAIIRDWDAPIHWTYVLSAMGESMLTDCYKKLLTSDTYKKKEEELEEYEEGVMLEWKAPLFAAYLGHVKVLDTLRQLSSPDTWVTESGWTWIHAAVIGDQISVLNKYTTDLSSIDRQITKNGHTALHVAARAGSEECITDWIKKGVNLNTRDVHEDTALYIALSRGHLGTARKLLEAGSVINPELCSEITATYNVIRKLELPSLITDEEHLLKVDIQYLWMTTVVQVKGTKLLFRFYKLVKSPRNAEVFKKIEDETGEEFGAVLEAVDGVWGAAVVASRYIRQHQLSVRQLVEEISREAQIHGLKVLYPPHAALCPRALAFTKLLLNKIKNISSDTFNVLVLLAALPHGHTVHDVSGYLELSTEQIDAVTKRLKSYRILYKEGLLDDMWALTHAFIIMEKPPSDIYVSLFSTALYRFERCNESMAHFVLDQINLKQLKAKWVQMLDRLQEAGCKSIKSPTSVTWSALHYATAFLNIYNSNFPEHVIEKLLELGVGVDVRGPGDVTPLHVAAFCSMTLRTVRNLLKNKAQVNAVTLEGLTPLHMAAFSGYKNASERIALLLEAGGKVNAMTHEGLTPLHMAVSCVYKIAKESTAVLLNAGGQVNAVTPEGLTTLHMAASRNIWDAHETIAMLFKAGGQVNAMTSGGLTPLHMAVSCGYKDANQRIAVLLKAGGQVNTVTPAGLTPLHMSASSNIWDAHETIAMLLKAGGKVNAMTSGGLTPLHMAASCNYMYAKDIIAVLLKAGGKVNTVTLEGLIPLHMAVSNRRTDAHEIIAVLLNAGGQVNAVTPEGLTPLHMAASNHRTVANEIIAVLLKSGGQVNAVTPEGLTPLHMAVSRTYRDPLYIEQRIREFLQAGADPQIKDKQGRTPLDVATPESRDILESCLHLNTFK